MGYEEIERRAGQLGLPVYQYLRQESQRALRLTARLNRDYHEPEEVTALFSQLIGRPVGEGFCLSPPLPHRLRAEHPGGEGRVHQLGLPLPRSGGHHHWGRGPDRSQCGTGHPEP